MLREGLPPVRDRFMVMLFLAGLVHAMIILGLTFGAPGATGQPAPGLQVLLVSEELPTADSNESAAYLAQRTQHGAGNTTDAVSPRNRASSIPVPAQDGTLDGNTLGPDGNTAGNHDERVLTTSWKSTIRFMPDPGDSGTANSKPLLLTEQRSDQPGPENESEQAQLRGPKRDELWITPDTRAASLAPYLDAWRRKVERIGTLNYPRAAQRLGVSPVLEVAIAQDGTLEKAVIRRSSGYPDLDAASLQILKLASPFDPFPAELARDYRLLRFAYEWQFEGGRHDSTVSTLP